MDKDSFSGTEDNVGTAASSGSQSWPQIIFYSSFDDFILLDTFNVVFPLYSNPDAKLPYIQCLLHKMDFLPSLQKEIRVVVIIGVLCLHIQDKS